ncbi:ABC transporter permease [Bifidobacterium choloepi]|uniref:ABC transporter permease n=1 Tax=Bifidobacterium choloepi TaxID=2614131 RepID=A0A6I5N1R0_9BIFI|nr:ABC transporter permease [Bifidobacterium choloepi]NEG70095.1 ABC transporter permease [Bifidobacterium choloepi]
MIRIGLRDAKSHLRRFVMSIVAIALGVAFVVGSFCFRAMLDSQVESMMATNTDADVYVRGATAQKNDDSSDSAAMPSDESSGSSGDDTTRYNLVDPDLMTTIDGVDGVAESRILYNVSNVVLVGADGDATSTLGGSTMTVGLGDGTTWRSTSLTDGRWPTADDEIALLDDSAGTAGLKVGDTTTIVYPDGPKDVKVVGEFSCSSAQAGTIIVAIPVSLAKSYYQQQNDTTDVDEIGVYGSMTTALSEAEQQDLADRINAALPADSDATAVTGDSVREESTKSTQEQLGFIQPLILIFAVIALFVGSFIIANTFSMIVRDSMRGYALLRSIGASPAQIFMTVIIQAIVLGVIGSVIGIFLSWGMLALIAAGLGQMGMSLSGSVTPSWSDCLVGLVVGLVVTLVGATWPARTAATAPPIQAMNETVNPEKPVRPRAVLGGVMTILGAGCWWFTVLLANAKAAGDGGPTPWDAVNDMSVGWPLGVGAGLVVLGIIVLAPALVVPAQAVLGWIPSHVWPVTGRLATRNISRAKRRTANTATALFVGVAIVSCLGVVAASAKTSVNSLVDTGFKGDFVVMNAANGQITEEEIDAVKSVKDIDVVSPISMIMGVKYGGERIQGMTMTAESNLFTDIFEPTTTAGNAVTALDDGELVVGSKVAERQGWTVGETVDVSADQIEVDEDATQAAIEAYRQQVQQQVTQLQAEAQQLLAAGDTAGAQAKADEATKTADEAQDVDQSQFVKTKTTTVTKQLVVGAIIDNSVYQNYVFVNEDLGGELGTEQTTFTMVMYLNAAAGADLATVQTDLEKAVKPYYVLTVMNRDEFKSTVSSMIDQVLMILYALLALSILIAIFGIVNTLALNVSERTREIGLLRAIGTSRGQVRGMLGIEAAIISVFGTLLGIVVGVGAGAVIRAAYQANGLNTLSIPWSMLAWFLVLSIVVGLVASVSPASRALKQPILDAVASE